LRLISDFLGLKPEKDHYKCVEIATALILWLCVGFNEKFHFSRYKPQNTSATLMVEPICFSENLTDNCNVISGNHMKIMEISPYLSHFYHITISVSTKKNAQATNELTKVGILLYLIYRKFI